MALITNTNRITPIGLPSGSVIPPGAGGDGAAWGAIKAPKKRAIYVGTRGGGGGGGVQSDSQGGEEAYRQQLFAELKALGVNAGANSKTETLVSKLAEVKAKAAPPADEAAEKQVLIDQLAALGVPSGPDASLEELQKALADKQVEQQ